MNRADLELCKELYGLSGWEPLKELDGVKVQGRLPEYDCGYLLRKLPSRWWLKYRGTDYVAKWDDRVNEQFAYANTPENALCELAIKLFKQNILEKE